MTGAVVAIGRVTHGHRTRLQQYGKVAQQHGVCETPLAKSPERGKRQMGRFTHAENILLPSGPNYRCFHVSPISIPVIEKRQLIDL